MNFDTNIPRQQASGGAIAYLKVEKPRFLFLEGSTGAVATTDVDGEFPST
jgi:hypothetical protein